VRLDPFQRCVHADVHAASHEQLRRVVNEPRWGLGEDLRRGVDQHPMLRHPAQHRVVAHGVAHEVGKLSECLHAGVAGADEDEGQLAAAMRVRRGGYRNLEPRQHVVSQVGRLGERLEAERVLGEAGNRQRADDRAE
jgi:hypothetical protein